MDGRGRLAQSLTRLAPWRARPSAKPPPAARARGRARVRLPWWLLRPMWRVLRPILQAQPPRGAGVAAAALIMLASVAYGVVRGDHVATIVEALKDLRDSAANAAGFRIVALALTGERHMSREQVRASILIGERRWNLRLKNGLDVRLPEDGAAPALERLLALDRDNKLITRDIAIIDLRLPDRVTVRLSPAAAQARSDALKDK